MKKSASDAMNLVKKQQEGGNSEVEELRNENEKLSQQIEDLNLQLLQQHIAKGRFTLYDVTIWCYDDVNMCRNDDVIIDFVKHEKSKDFQKNPEEESLASEIGMLEIDEITMKVSFMLLDVITWLSFLCHFRIFLRNWDFEMIPGALKFPRTFWPTFFRRKQ